MRRLLVLVLAFVFAVSGMMAVYAGNEPGPAPNSGDGIPDGPGWPPDQPGPFGTDGETRGPAPYSGDGIPDGPGW